MEKKPSPLLVIAAGAAGLAGLALVAATVAALRRMLRAAASPARPTLEELNAQYQAELLTKNQTYATGSGNASVPIVDLRSPQAKRAKPHTITSEELARREYVVRPGETWADIMSTLEVSKATSNRLLSLNGFTIDNPTLPIGFRISLGPRQQGNR